MSSLSLFHHVQNGVTLFVYEDGEYKSRGNNGCAIMGSRLLYQVLFYSESNPKVASCTIKPGGMVNILLDKNYASFTGDDGAAYSMMFRAEEDISEFFLNFALAQYQVGGQGNIAMEYVTGVGHPAAHGNSVGVKYSAYTVNENENGLPMKGAVYSSNGDPIPFSLKIGSGTVDLGFEAGLVGARRDSKRVVVVPANCCSLGVSMVYTVAIITEPTYLQGAIPQQHLIQNQPIQLAPQAPTKVSQAVIQEITHIHQLQPATQSTGFYGQSLAPQLSAPQPQPQPQPHPQAAVPQQTSSALSATALASHPLLNLVQSQLTQLSSQQQQRLQELTMQVQQQQSLLNSSLEKAVGKMNAIQIKVESVENHRIFKDTTGSLSGVALSSSISRIITENETMKQEIAEKEEKLSSLKQKIHDMRKQTDMYSQESNHLLEEKNQVLAQASNIKLEMDREVQRVKDQLLRAHSERDDAQRHLDLMKKMQETGDAELAKLKTRLDHLETKTLVDTERIEELQKTLREERSVRKAAQDRCNALRDELQEEKSARVRVESELQEKKRKLEANTETFQQQIEKERAYGEKEVQRLRDEHSEYIAKRERKWEEERERVAEDARHIGLEEGKVLEREVANTQLQRLRAEHKDALRLAEEKFNAEKADFQAELSRVAAEHAADLQSAKVEHNQQLRFAEERFTGEKNALQADLSRLDSEHSAEIRRIKELHITDTKAAEERFASERAILKAELSKMTERHSAEKKEWATEASRLAASAVSLISGTDVTAAGMPDHTNDSDGKQAEEKHAECSAAPTIDPSRGSDCVEATSHRGDECLTTVPLEETEEGGRTVETAIASDEEDETDTIVGTGGAHGPVTHDSDSAVIQNDANSVKDSSTSEDEGDKSYAAQLSVANEPLSDGGSSVGDQDPALASENPAEIDAENGDMRVPEAQGDHDTTPVCQSSVEDHPPKDGGKSEEDTQGDHGHELIASGNPAVAEFHTEEGHPHIEDGDDAAAVSTKGESPVQSEQVEDGHDAALVSTKRESPVQSEKKSPLGDSDEDDGRVHPLPADNTGDAKDLPKVGLKRSLDDSDEDDQARPEEVKTSGEAPKVGPKKGIASIFDDGDDDEEHIILPKKKENVLLTTDDEEDWVPKVSAKSQPKKSKFDSDTDEDWAPKKDTRVVSDDDDWMPKPAAKEKAKKSRFDSDSDAESPI